MAPHRSELVRLKAIAKTGEERRWLESTAVPKVPTMRIIQLSQILGDLGRGGCPRGLIESLTYAIISATSRFYMWPYQGK